MNYRLNLEERLEKEMKRVAHEQIDEATNHLSQVIHHDKLTTKADSVHEARKVFKKIRGLLRLFRYAIGKEVYQQENYCFRDAGRLLSSVRDAQVHIETFESFSQEISDTVSSELLAQIHHILIAYQQIIYKQIFETQDNLLASLSFIKQAQERVEDWLVDEDWSMISQGLKKVYKRGYKDFSQVLEDPTTEKLHEWRKRVKYLWYHLRILKPIWPEVMITLAKQTHELSTLLGDDHDLANLQQLLLNRPDLVNDKPEINLLFVNLERKRKKLQQSAFLKGQRIYAESPKYFTKRIGCYWQAEQRKLMAEPVMQQ
ncbi:MAG: CHAD domain-containing protein [Cyanobacteria bacterium P01_G01_bin.49]